MRFKQWTGLLRIVGAMVILCGASTPAGRHSGGIGEVRAASVEQWVCRYCYENGGGHSIPDDGQCVSTDPNCFKCDLMEGFSHMRCHSEGLDGGCGSHPSCAASLASAALADRIEGNSQDVALLLREHRDNYLVNRERGVIQLLGCRHEIIAQYPLTDRLALSLSLAQAVGQ